MILNGNNNRNIILMTDRVTHKIATIALQEAAIKVVYEDEFGQSYIPIDKMFKLASQKTGLDIDILRWAHENRTLD